ncbi:MAG TPA: tetratricopeptide repeat protein [Kofleriaceae bacterium]|nr:tetratricopeptide repeat protein [Kofleriaceae bacterium]
MRRAPSRSLGHLGPLRHLGHLAAVLLCLPAAARADDLDRKLSAYDLEVRQLGTNLPEPGKLADTTGQRRLVDAEVAFALGDYDTAALMLFELANQPGPDQLAALYYLGESLYQKNDRSAARTYFEQLAVAQNAASRYYQPALLRLVEIAIVQRDDSSVDKHIAALDAIPAGSRLPQVPYVRGKYAYSQDKHDDALRFFGEVPKGSTHEYQAVYFTATTLVAKKDLARATDVLTELLSRKPRTTNDRRVIELGQIALGRIYYERDQPSKAIDSYLLVDRRSDLFPDVLYEVAWVYVKAKQFDKALRTLELLSLADPTSQRTPTVRILEGNLRLRKAQQIRQRGIAGTLENGVPSDPSVEYDKAAQVFSETHDWYFPSYQALAHIVDRSVDPAQYLAQIAGRKPAIFQATAPLPEAAVAYLREEPDVRRMVSVETDLAEVSANLVESQAVLARLEGVLAANDKTVLYPALQRRRSRVGQIQDDLNKVRGDLAEQQLRLLSGRTGPGASTTRRILADQYGGLPGAEQVAADRMAQVLHRYDTLEQSAAEVSATLDATQAMSVALGKYAVEATPPLSAAQQSAIAQTLEGAAHEAAAIEKVLAVLAREIELGRDLAGIGDETVGKAREARRQLKAALDAEHRALAAAAASGTRDRRKTQKLSEAGERAARISDAIVQIEAQIDAKIDRGMEQVKLTITAEREQVAAYQAELASEEAEARAIGGTVLGGSFRDVKAKFYDIVIRSDVGSVDVAWAQKEDADDDLKRLTLSRQRDTKQLRDEFKGILIEEGPGKPKPATPGAGPEGGAGGAGGAGAAGAAGSPDKGGAGRVKPGGDNPVKPPTPTVRPDNEQDKAPETPKPGAAPKTDTPAATPKATTPKATTPKTRTPKTRTPKTTTPKTTTPKTTPKAGTP